MLLSALKFSTLYSDLALFEKEKGWRCGKSFISYRAKCYRNPKTGKIAYKTIVNPKTGRRNKVKVGLGYKDYQKARKSAIKKKGQGKRITGLEKKYIADAERLALSTKKKKQRRLDAKNKRKAKKDTPSYKDKLNEAVKARIDGSDKFRRLYRGLVKADPKKAPQDFKQAITQEVDRDVSKKDLTARGERFFKDYRQNISDTSNKEVNNQIGLMRGDILRKDDIAISRVKLDQYHAYRAAQKDYAESRAKLGWKNPETFKPGKTEKSAPQSKSKETKQLDLVDKTKQSKSSVSNYQDFIDIRKRLDDGDITAAEMKQAFQDTVDNEAAIKESLKDFKKPVLLRLAGWGARSSDKKSQLIDNAYESIEQSFTPPGSGAVSYPIDFDKKKNRENRYQAIKKQVDGWTDEKIQERAKERKQAITERDKAIKDPKTIDDFRTLIRNKGQEGLTVAQRAKYEDMVTLKNRGDRKESKPKIEAVELPANKSFKLSQTTHTKKGHDVYVASLTERVDRDKYNSLNKRAKSLGGYYSRYARDGAVPGFQFRDEESARKFMGLEETEGRDKSGERQVKSVDRLKDNAEKLIEKNEAKLNQDRKANTARRARMAASTEGDARAEIAIAKTMLKIADAKENDTVQFLDRVKTGTEVRQLSSILNRSRYNAARKIAEKEYPDDGARDPNQYKRLKRKEELEDKPIDEDTIEYAEYPYPSIHKENLRNLLSEARSQKGMKLLANRLDQKYKAIANKDKVSVVEFKKDSEIEDVRKLVSQGKYESVTKYSAENLKESLKDYDRINKTLDLKTPYELRAALREFNRLKSQKASEDPIKAKERALIGRKIEGYFPTPKPVIDKMLDYADLKTGERILEPSAGKGNIGERIREKVGNDTLSTIEIDRDLSDLLDQKGFNNRRDDFLNITEERYDKVIMNPPFEKLQDTEHVRHAYDLLAPGGKLVSVMGESAFFQEQKKAKEFRQWLQDKEGYSEKLPEGSFKDSERSTGVNTRLVVIEKPLETKKKKRKANYSQRRNNRIIRFNRSNSLLKILSN